MLDGRLMMTRFATIVLCHCIYSLANMFLYAGSGDTQPLISAWIPTSMISGGFFFFFLIVRARYHYLYM